MIINNLIPGVFANEIPIKAMEGSGLRGLETIGFNEILSGLITLALILAVITCFAFLVAGGIQWITGKAEEGRKKILAALIGLIIVFAVWAILSLVEIFFGINLTSFSLNSLAGSDSSLPGSNEPPPDSSETGLCPCGGGATGLCAVPGNTGPLTYDPTTGTGPCYLCTTNGWVTLGYECEYIPNNSPDCRYPCI